MIFKVFRHEGNFTTISNAPFENPDLSFKAKGVLAYLLTRKKDWIIHVNDLKNHSTNGRDSIYGALKELRQAGHAEIRTERKDGRIFQKYWAIYEEPVLTRESTILKSRIKKTRTVSKDLLINKDERYNEARSRAASDVPSFDMETSPIKKYDYSPKLVELFYQELAKIRKHKARADLPTGDSPASKQRRKHTFYQWEQESNLLLYELRGDIEMAKKVMVWYFKHRKDDKFMPACYAMRTFREKFEYLQCRMVEQNGNGTTHQKITVEEDEDSDTWKSDTFEQEQREHVQAVRDGRKRRGFE